MKFASIAALCILALSFILCYSEAFVVRRLVVSPAFSTNKQLWTTAPPQYARFPALRDDPKGLYDVIFNVVPVALLAFTVSMSVAGQDKSYAAQDRAIAAREVAQDKAIAAERERQDKAIAVEKEGRKEAFAAQEKSMEKVIAAERDNLKAALLQQNEVWSLRFENYAAKAVKVKENDGLPSA